MKKFVSTLTSLCMSVSLTAGALGAISVSAAVSDVPVSKTLKLLAVDGTPPVESSTKTSNYTISADEIAAGDVTITVGVYLEETEADTGAITARWQLGDCADSSAIKMHDDINLYSATLPEYSYTFEGGSYAGTTITTTSRLAFAGNVTRRGVYTPAGGIFDTAMNLTDTMGYFVYTAPSGAPWLGATSDAFPVHEFSVTLSQNAAPGEYHIDFVNEDAKTGVNQSTTQIGYVDTTIHEQLDNLFYGGLGTEGLTITVEGDTPTTTAPTTTAPTTSTTAAPTTTAPTTSSTTTSSSSSGNVDPLPDGLVWKVQDVTISREDLIADEGYIYIDVYVAQTADQTVQGAAFTFDFSDEFTWEDEEFNPKNAAYGNVTNVIGTTEPRVNFECGKKLDSGLVVGRVCEEEGAVIVGLCLKATDPEGIAAGTYPITMFLDKSTNTPDRVVADNFNNDAPVSFVDGSITIVDADAPTTSTAPTTTAPTTTTTTAPTTTAPITSSQTPSTSGDVLYGDTNVDGVVNIADVVTLNQYLSDAEKYPLSAQGMINAEVNLDGNITAADSTSIIKSIVKLVTLPDTSSNN